MVRTALGGRTMNRLVLTSTALVFVILGCNTSSSDSNGSSAAPAGATPAGPTTVTTVPVASRKLQTTIALAQLVPYEQVDIYPKVTGFVETVTVNRASRVQRVQLLVRLTAPELISQRSQAEAAVRSAQSQLATAQAKLVSDNGTYQHMV